MRGRTLNTQKLDEYFDALLSGENVSKDSWARRQAYNYRSQSPEFAIAEQFARAKAALVPLLQEVDLCEAQKVQNYLEAQVWRWKTKFKESREAE